MRPPDPNKTQRDGLSPEQLRELRCRLNVTRQPVSIRSSVSARAEKSLVFEWEHFAAYAAGLQEATTLQSGAAIGFDVVEEASMAYVSRLLTRHGLFTDAHKSHTADEVRLQLRAADRFSKLVSLWLVSLSRAGLLRCAGNSFVGQLKESSDPRRLLSDLLSSVQVSPGVAALAEAVRICGDNLAELLEGRINAVDLLFNERCIAIPRAGYHNSASAAFVSALIVPSLQWLIQRLPPTRILNVFEVGAGLGSGTTRILASLPSDRILYTISDKSRFFAEQARRTFGANASVRYAVFDINRSLCENGVDPRSADVVIAINVLHCARSVVDALRSLRDFLVPGGVLMFVENTLAYAWHSVVLGFLAGFLDFEDERVQAGHPMISCRRWRNALEEAGYGQQIVMPELCAVTEQVSIHAFYSRTVTDARECHEQ